MVAGWERPLCKTIGRSIALDRPSTTGLTTVIDGSFRQITRALERGDSGPVEFDLLLQLGRRQSGRGGTTSARSESLHFCISNGTPYWVYYRAFQIVLSGVTCSERALPAGVGMVP